MKQRMIKTMASVVLAGLCVVGALDALGAEIDQVVVRQRWPWSRLVDIDYTLLCDPTETWSINITAYDGTQKLDLPLLSFSSDLLSVSAGTHRIVWDPMASAYTNRGSLTSFRVELEATVPPLYMIVDLTKDAGEDDQIEYVYEADLHAGTWGSCVTNPVSNDGTVIPSLVWTGVTNNSSYVTTKLVLRYVPAGTFGMGENADLSTTLTKTMYVGVFQVTDAQWKRALGNDGGETRPKYIVSYEEIRGASTNVPSINWPFTDRTVVATNSFLAKLRSKTGIADFDLPTEAQWEYFCRAGTTTVFNDGNADAKYEGTEDDFNNGTTNKYLDVLGWYWGNSRSWVRGVGRKTPNAWGLYDTHGNVCELCLDWEDASLSGGHDPVGADSSLYRVGRGGSWNNPASGCRSANRRSLTPSYRSNNTGFRLVRTLP